MGDRHVAPDPDGGWEITKPGAQRASERLPSQGLAMERAREMVRREGGGELIVHGTEGWIRSKNTIFPGRDPYPPAG